MELVLISSAICLAYGILLSTCMGRLNFWPRVWSLILTLVAALALGLAIEEFSGFPVNGLYGTSSLLSFQIAYPKDGKEGHIYLWARTEGNWLIPSTIKTLSVPFSEVLEKQLNSTIAAEIQNGEEVNIDQYSWNAMSRSRNHEVILTPRGRELK